MKSPFRFALVPLAFGLACSGFALTCPQWARDFADSTFSQTNETEQPEQVRVEAQRTRTQQSLALKSIITDDLIAGRTTLAEAVEQFRALDLTDPAIMAAVRLSFPAASEDESVTLQVIQFVRSALAYEPSRQEETVCRLQAAASAMKVRASADVN
jgi:hypothetical protein